MHLTHRHRILRNKKAPAHAISLKRVFSVAAVDVLVYAVSCFSLFFTLDQARIIWLSHDAHGVSLVTWGFYVLSSIIWVLYGTIHRDRVLIIVSVGGMIVDALIVIGIILNQ